MKYILLINGLVEVIGGFILIFNPQFLLSNASPELQGIVVAKLYGVMIFAFGMISFLLYKHFSYQELFKKIILIVISLHLVIGLYMYGVYQQGLTPHVGASATHLGLAIISMIIYLKNIQNFTNEQPTA